MSERPRFIEVEELIRAKIGGEPGDKWQPLVEMWARGLARRGTVVPRHGEPDFLSELLENFNAAAEKHDRADKQPDAPRHNWGGEVDGVAYIAHGDKKPTQETQEALDAVMRAALNKMREDER